MQYYRVFP